MWNAALECTFLRPHTPRNQGPLSLLGPPCGWFLGQLTPSGQEPILLRCMVMIPGQEGSFQFQLLLSGRTQGIHYEQIKPGFSTHQPVSITFQNPSKPQCEQMPPAYGVLQKQNRCCCLPGPVTGSHSPIPPRSACIECTVYPKVHGSSRGSTPSLPAGPTRTFTLAFSDQSSWLPTQPAHWEFCFLRMGSGLYALPFKKPETWPTVLFTRYSGSITFRCQAVQPFSIPVQSSSTLLYS